MLAWGLHLPYDFIRSTVANTNQDRNTPVSTPNVKDAILRIKDLPTLPSVLGKILATAADPDASALDLGQHISADQSLSATLLKLVNSAYYGFYRQISSITQAIVMLGFLEVRNLTLTATAFRTLSKSSSSYDRIQLWRHSLATAMAAERINKRLKLGIEGSFESGLLHDFGKVALDMLYPDEFRQAAGASHARECFIFESEREVFDTDHAEVGGLLGEHWNLPPAVVEAIRLHHQPEAAEKAPRLVALIAVANFVTYGARLGESSNGRAPEFPAAAAEVIGVSEAFATELADELSKEHNKVDEFLGTLKG